LIECGNTRPRNALKGYFPLILEAFSTHLKAHNQPNDPPERILMEWLTTALLYPPAPGDMIGKILHTEISRMESQGYYWFEGKSDTGRELLNTLTQYCRSYDHWQFSRWVHEVRASDFNQRKYGS
jgi:hypothetical protein